MSDYSANYTVKVSIPPYGKDWNDTLKFIVTSKNKNKIRRNNYEKNN